MSTTKVPVVFTLHGNLSQQAADEIVNRVLRYGFEAVSEHEPATHQAVKHWQFAEIRGRKVK